MSLAFEITRDDLETILERHGITDPVIIDQAEVLIEDEDDRITDAALEFDSMELQTDSAYDEIENILIENGLLTEKKCEPLSAEDDYSDEQWFDDPYE